MKEIEKDQMEKFAWKASPLNSPTQHYEWRTWKLYKEVEKSAKTRTIIY